jgi:pSer/pThr/pTyr-binding forkhead associated (FHA) protein
MSCWYRLMQVCPQCNGAVSDGGSFCQFCGATLKERGPVCGECGTRNPNGTNFCYTCGARVAAARVSTPGIVMTPSEGPPLEAGAARLVAVRRDGTDGESFAIDLDQLDIGRSEGDLRFDDPHLAPRHARIVRRAGQYLLTPLETRNGVYVRISQAYELQDGDQFLVGKQVLRFEMLTDAEKVLRPAIEHGVVLFGTPVRAPWGRLRQLTAAGTSRDLYHLTRNEVSMGREQGDIVFSEDEFLSRRHAQLQLRGGIVTIQDLGSSNGTYVRLRGQHTLVPGEMIRMGDELLRFELG